jgi:ribonuclease BN (tRNA processing enzyme)
MIIRILGAHHNELTSARMLSLLIDGKVAIDTGSLTSNLSWDEQLALKAILLPHQHYDHIRDLPCAIVPFFRTHRNIAAYATKPVCETIRNHLINGEFYPNFLERPEGHPALTLNVIEPDKAISIEGYNILAIDVNHPVPTVGYQVTSSEGKAFFFGGDSGPGMQTCWEKVSPQLVILDVTYNNDQEQRAERAGHLTPNTLKQELITFQKLKGYLPKIVAIHMDPDVEKEIISEVETVSRDLGISIEIACEGMEIYM